MGVPIEVDDLKELRKAIKNFDDEHTVEEIILLGFDGAIRRIQMVIENG